VWWKRTNCTSESGQTRQGTSRPPRATEHTTHGQQWKQQRLQQRAMYARWRRARPWTHTGRDRRRTGPGTQLHRLHDRVPTREWCPRRCVTSVLCIRLCMCVDATRPNHESTQTRNRKNFYRTSKRNRGSQQNHTFERHIHHKHYTRDPRRGWAHMSVGCALRTEERTEPLVGAGGGGGTATNARAPAPNGAAPPSRAPAPPPLVACGAAAAAATTAAAPERGESTHRASAESSSTCTCKTTNHVPPQTQARVHDEQKETDPGRPTAYSKCNQSPYEAIYDPPRANSEHTHHIALVRRRHRRMHRDARRQVERDPQPERGRQPRGRERGRLGGDKPTQLRRCVRKRSCEIFIQIQMQIYV
jgi:hypothetical protein